MDFSVQGYTAGLQLNFNTFRIIHIEFKMPASAIPIYLTVFKKKKYGKSLQKQKADDIQIALYKHNTKDLSNDNTSSRFGWAYEGHDVRDLKEHERTKLQIRLE